MKFFQKAYKIVHGRPCGKYVGGIKKTDRGYEEFFSTTVGEVSHNSSHMVELRRKEQEIIESKKQKVINDEKVKDEKVKEETEDIDR